MRFVSLRRNDVSVRDFQYRHGGKRLKGKNFDRSWPMGPMVVTPEGVDSTVRLTVWSTARCVRTLALTQCSSL